MDRQTKILEMLKNEAVKNPVFNAACHAFAVRQRTRFTVTTLNLRQTLIKSGWKDVTREQCAEVLKFLNSLGFGTLTFDSKKRIKSLDQIKVTLQSIGKAAIAGAGDVKKHMPPNKFTALAVKDVKTEEAANTFVAPGLQTPAPISQAKENNYPAFLTIMINGRPINFACSAAINEDNLGEFLVKFKELAKADL